MLARGGAGGAPWAAAAVLEDARYIRGLAPTLTASPRATRVSQALPTAPPECPSIFASSVTLNFKLASTARILATAARSSPGRAFEGAAEEAGELGVAGAGGGWVFIRTPIV
ncbi:hypothetical protein SSP35_27_00450 [Streptomyces sp. NBRC 110611]|nr:hypothetical protein SSP35_27_00450 [Streptomyces sp. NBRC 110611]